MAADHDSVNLQERSDDELAALIRSAITQLTSRGTPDAFRALVELSAELGTGLGASVSSFCFFSSGALIPILPYIFGMSGLAAVFLSAGLVGIALLITGGIVGLLSGKSPGPRALRQLGIGFGAAAVTYALGLLFGGTA